MDARRRGKKGSCLGAAFRNWAPPLLALVALGTVLARARDLGLGSAPGSIAVTPLEAGAAAGRAPELMRSDPDAAHFPAAQQQAVAGQPASGAPPKEEDGEKGKMPASTSPRPPLGMSAAKEAEVVRLSLAHPWQEDPPWGWMPWPRPNSPAAEHVWCKDCCNDGTAQTRCLDVDACAAKGPEVGKYAFVLSHINVPKLDEFLPYVGSMRAQVAAAAPNTVDIVLVMPKVDSRRLRPRQLEYLKDKDVILMEVDWMLPPGMKFYREKMWCGPKDLVRLHALGIEGYDAVAYFDSDIEFQGDTVPLFRCAATGRFLTANGLDGVPLNVGVFAVKPDARLLQAAEYFARESEYNDSFGWAASGFAPAQKHKFRTAECGQGFLHTLLYKRGSAMALKALTVAGLGEAGFIGAQVDRCVWNYQGDDCRPGFNCSFVRVHHKPSPDAVVKFAPRHDHACKKWPKK